MKIRIIILALALLFGNMGCVWTTSALIISGIAGGTANKITDYKLAKRSLDLKEDELELKREDFEYRKEAFR